MEYDQTSAIVALQLAVSRNAHGVTSSESDVLAEAHAFYAFLTNPTTSTES